MSRLLRAVSAVLLALAACAASAGAASADTATISFLDAAGTDDPVDGVGRTLTIKGNVTSPKDVFVRFRRPGGAACTPAASSDSGAYDFSNYSRVYGTDANGDFTITRSGRFHGSGEWQFCIWLAERESTVTTPITQIVSFRSPGGTISAVPTPSTIQLGQSSTLTISGASEAPAEVFVKTRPAGGAPCAATAASDVGSYAINGRDVDGAFSTSETIKPDTAGATLICLWLAGSSSDTTPIAGPQAATVTVLAPPPPCVVPAVPAGSPLTAAIGALAAASCTLGAQTLQPSATHPAGTFLSFSPTEGRSLPTGAPVAVVVSAGKPCTVPRVARRMTLRRARSALRANGCSVGTVRRVRSARRAGRVVRFSSAAGAVRAPGSRIGIRVSRGRGGR